MEKKGGRGKGRGSDVACLSGIELFKFYWRKFSCVWFRAIRMASILDILTHWLTAKMCWRPIEWVINRVPHILVWWIYRPHLVVDRWVTDWNCRIQFSGAESRVLVTLPRYWFGSRSKCGNSVVFELFIRGSGLIVWFSVVVLIWIVWCLI